MNNTARNKQSWNVESKHSNKDAAGKPMIIAYQNSKEKQARAFRSLEKREMMEGAKNEENVAAKYIKPKARAPTDSWNKCKHKITTIDGHCKVLTCIGAYSVTQKNDTYRRKSRQFQYSYVSLYDHP